MNPDIVAKALGKEVKFWNESSRYCCKIVRRNYVPVAVIEIFTMH